MERPAHVSGCICSVARCIFIEEKNISNEYGVEEKCTFMHLIFLVKNSTKMTPYLNLIT
jgi:hypothetical protein